MHEDTIEKSIKIAIALTALFFGIEVIGGLISGSLSLLSDAGHMLRDVFGLITTLSAINIAKKIPTKTKTFGYHRLEIFAALFNGLLLFIMSGWILWESYFRLISPRPIESITMFVIALIGLLINLYVASRLHGSHDVNIRSAFTHVLMDTLSSVAVIFASIWIFFTNQTFVDPILGIVIGVFILYSAFMIIKDSVCILLDFTPKDVLFDDVIKDIESVKGVDSVHNVHLWSLCSHINVIDAHIYTTESDMRKIELIKEKIKQKLKKYDIKHTTLEFECQECVREDKVSEVRH
jgi:cobalt-zinc-cadmium efflux system protein